jgi:hypothetical protein
MFIHTMHPTCLFNKKIFEYIRRILRYFLRIFKKKLSTKSLQIGPIGHVYPSCLFGCPIPPHPIWQPYLVLVAYLAALFPTLSIYFGLKVNVSLSLSCPTLFWNTFVHDSLVLQSKRLTKWILLQYWTLLSFKVIAFWI